MSNVPIPEVYGRARLIEFLKKFFAVRGSSGGGDADCCDEKGPDGALRYNNDGTLTGSAKITFDGTDLIASSIIVSDVTSGRVLLGGTSGAIVDNTDFTFNGTVLEAPQVSSSAGMSASAFHIPAGELGTGDVSVSGTPADNYVSVWTDANTIEGSTALTFNGSTLSASTSVSASSFYADGELIGHGDVHTTGTPANNQLAVWTNSDTLEGDSDLTWDGTGLKVINDPCSLSEDTGIGDIIKFGGAVEGNTLATGRLMYLSGSDWRYTDADIDLSGGTQLLGIALGDAPSNGILLKGFFKSSGTYLENYYAGAPLYTSRTPSSVTTSLKGLKDNGAYIRILGFCAPCDNVIYFNPDGIYHTSGSEG